MDMGIVTLNYSVTLWYNVVDCVARNVIHI